MSTPSTHFDFKRITHPSNRLGLIGAGLLVVTIIFGVYQAIPILKAVRAGGASSQTTDGSDSVLKFASTLKNDADQINGRSFFFDPPPPPPPERPKPPPVVEEYKPAPPPSKPTNYGGPKVVGTAFDTVWFDNNKTMRVGGPLESDMRIISISTAPYVVKIEWKEVAFDVPFLPRDSVIDKSRPAPPAPPPEPTPPTPDPAAIKPAEPAPAGATPPATPGEKKEEKKEEKKDEPKPAGEKPAAPPDKKDGPT